MSETNTEQEQEVVRRHPLPPLGNISAETQHLLEQSALTEQRFIALAQERGRQLAEATAAANAAAEALNNEHRLAESISEPQLRERLLDTILGYNNAFTKLSVAEANVERAAQRMADADAELRDYSQLDRQIADWNVQQIKTDTNDPLPEELAAAQLERGHIIDRLDAAHKAHDVLQAELKAAQDAVTDCATIRSRAAAHVISKYMDTLAEQLAVTIEAMTALQRKLISTGSLWVHNPNGPQPIRLSPKAIEVVHKQIEEARPDQPYMDTIKAWHGRLQSDSDAVLEE